jgi:hypothetical protein
VVVAHYGIALVFLYPEYCHRVKPPFALKNGTKKAADFYMKICDAAGQRKRDTISHSIPFSFDIQFLVPFPLARCHKNIDFTGFLHVFLCHRGNKKAVFHMKNDSINLSNLK